MNYNARMALFNIRNEANKRALSNYLQDHHDRMMMYYEGWMLGALFSTTDWNTCEGLAARNEARFLQTTYQRNRNV